MCDLWHEVVTQGTAAASAAATTSQIPVQRDQGRATFAESGIKLLLCDAPEGLGALDNYLEKSDFFLFFFLSRGTDS